MRKDAWTQTVQASFSFAGTAKIRKRSATGGAELASPYIYFLRFKRLTSHAEP